MQHEEIITGTLEIQGRLPSSRMGNPRYEVVVRGTDPLPTIYSTQPDSMLAYGITNYRGKLVKAKVGYYYGSPSVESIELISPEDTQQ